MQISGSTTTQAAAQTGNTPAAATPAKSTGGEQFMQILLAQLRNQNPMDPMADKDMMAQMVQLNSLMELQKMNTNLEALLQQLQPAEEGEGDTP